MSPAPRSLLAVLAPALRALGYAAALVALGDALLLRWPAADGWALFGEDGRLEIAQVGLLGLAAAGAALLALRRADTRPVSVLLLGLLLAVLVREHNNHFKDLGFRGLWQLVVAAVAIGTLAAAWPARARTLPALARYLGSPALPWMGAALCALAFGQLFDEPGLWRLILGSGDVPYAARRAGEEGFETLAYACAAISILEYRLALGAPPPPA